MASPDKQGTRTDRLFAIVLLLQSRPNMTSRDLAQHFNVTRRTIFRDLRALSESGVPLTYSEGGGYEILDGFQLPPLMLSAREAATLLVGTEFMKLQADASLRTDADAVAMKIQAVLPREVNDFVTQLRQRTILDPYWVHAVQAGTDESGRWYKLSEAVARRRRVIMEYWVESRQELTKRRVDPYGLVYYTDHWNLIALDHLRDTVRNFRLDRIREMYVLTERFELQGGFDLSGYLQQQGMGSESVQVELEMDARTWNRVRVELPARIELTREEEGTVRVLFSFDNLDYLTGWMLRFGAAVRVLQPSELAERHRTAARAIASNYD